MIEALYKVFVEEDATLVEVNPLARLAGDKLEALDGKVSLDENAPRSVTRSTRRSRSARRPTLSSRRPRTSVSTTSSSTVPSASSATARASS